jgi:hypothetical protein
MQIKRDADSGFTNDLNMVRCTLCGPFPESILFLAPYSSGTWLLLASPEDLGSDRSAAAEALKMSYLTSTADFDLIPKRLGVFASVATKADPDLGDLARGDIRLILTQRPDLKAAISNAYANGSIDGKALTFELVNSQDPAFAATLR